MSVDIGEAKRLNEEIKKQKDRLNKLKAEADVQIRIIAENCKELSEELGFKVTPENINEVYEKESSKLREDCEKAKEILERLKKEVNI